MNLGQYLFGSLQEKGRVELPNFGVFSLQKNVVCGKKYEENLRAAFALMLVRLVILCFKWAHRMGKICLKQTDYALTLY